METDPTADPRADLARSGRSLVALLARRWHLLLAVTSLFGAAGFLFASLQSTLYSSSATMLLNDPGTTSVRCEPVRVTIVSPPGDGADRTAELPAPTKPPACSRTTFRAATPQSFQA